MHANLKADAISVVLGGTEVVRDVTLNVGSGRFVGLVGPNGSGKSSFLKTLYKVIKPHCGTAQIGDQNIFENRPSEVFRDLAVVSQFNDFSFDFTVREMVMLGRVPHKRLLEADSPLDKKRVDESLRRVDMIEHSHREYQTLSGGERQRVILARALAQDPSFLVLDEPTNHLDIKYQLEILDVVKSLDIGVLAALHDLSMAARYCDELYVLKEGSVVANGSPEEVLTRQLIGEVYEVDCETYTNPITGELAIAYLTKHDGA